MTTEDWAQFLEAVREAAEDVITHTGYGDISIIVVGGAPKEIAIRKSLRLREDAPALAAVQVRA